MTIPSALRVPHTLEAHGSVRVDNYYWMRNKSKETMDYILQENSYFESCIEQLQPLTESLYGSMTSFTPEKHEQVAIKYRDFFYYKKVVKGLQYPVYARKKSTSRDRLFLAQEEVILDINSLPRQNDYISVTGVKPSPSGRFLAFTQNTDGGDTCSLFIKSLCDDSVPLEVTSLTFSEMNFEWGFDDSQLFFTTVDENQRPNRVWCYLPFSSESTITLLYEDFSDFYYLTLARSTDERYLFINSQTSNSNELRYCLLTSNPLVPVLLLSAQIDVRYSADAYSEDTFVILSNKDYPDGHLYFFCIKDSSLTELFPVKHDCYFDSVNVFSEITVLMGRQSGQTAMWLFDGVSLKEVAFSGSVYTISLKDNMEYTTRELLISYESLTVPPMTLSISLPDGVAKVLKCTQLSGSFSSFNYTEKRLFVPSKDGALVPVILAYRSDKPILQPQPTILYGYGAYGANSDPGFSSAVISLLDHGVLYVIAQVRGGSELGGLWYDQGRLLHKWNSFNDFEYVARYLIDHNYTTQDLLAGMGASAGGLLVGVAATFFGDLFKVLALIMPFLDVLTTMSDDTIPFTVSDYDEWGNPQDFAHYQSILSYSPYDNIHDRDYPHILLVGGLNDPRVPFWEPLKFMAKLREKRTDSSTSVLKININGHSGSSGFDSRTRDLSEFYAFILDKLGVTL